MNRVYDADASSYGAAMDGLGVLQIGIHPCRWIQEPGAEMAGCVLGIRPLSGVQPGGCQGRHLHAESNQGMAMCSEVVGIGHPVTLDVGPVRVVWIRPPVVSFGEVVVPAAGATRSRVRRYGGGRLAHIPGRGAQDSGPVYFGNINSGIFRRSNLTPSDGSPGQAARG